MANERTLLAYLRTALMLIVSGATGWKLFGPDPVTITASVVLGALGFIVFLLGIRRYSLLKRMMSAGGPAPKDVHSSQGFVQSPQ